EELELRRNHQTCPAREKAKAAERRDHAEPVPRLRDERHRVKAAAEEEDTNGKKHVNTVVTATLQGQGHKGDSVHQVIKHRLVPSVEHAAGLQTRLESVRAI